MYCNCVSLSLSKGYGRGQRPKSLHTFSVLLMIGKYQGHEDDHWPYHIVTLIWFIYYSFGTVVTGRVLSQTPPSRPTRPGRVCGASWRARAAASIWTRRWSSATTLSGWWVGAVYLVQCGHPYNSVLSASTAVLGFEQYRCSNISDNTDAS